MKRETIAICSLKACIGWKPPKRSVKTLFSVSLSTRGDTNDTSQLRRAAPSDKTLD